MMGRSNNWTTHHLMTTFVQQWVSSPPFSLSPLSSGQLISPSILSLHLFSRNQDGANGWSSYIISRHGLYHLLYALLLFRWVSLASLIHVLQAVGVSLNITALENTVIIHIVHIYCWRQSVGKAGSCCFMLSSFSVILPFIVSTESAAESTER